MSGQHDTSSGFAKAFVPGLVLGLVVGAFVGATLPPLLSGKKLPDRQAGLTNSGSDRDRDREMIRDESGMLGEDGLLEEAPTDDPALEEPGTPDDASQPADTPPDADDAPPTEGETGGDEGNDDD